MNIIKKNSITNITRLCLLGFMGVLASTSVLAAVRINDLPIDQKDYVNRYIDAINSNDIEKLKKLSHSSYLSCINSTNQDYYDHVFQRSLRHEIPKVFDISITLLSEESVATEIEGARKIGLPYPIRPTHQLQIDYNKSEYSSVTIVRKLTVEAGNIYETSGCPTPVMVKRFREMRIKKEERRKQAERLFQKLEEPLLSELRQLLKDGQKIAAWKRYSEVTGESLATAKEVLSHIQ